MIPLDLLEDTGGRACGFGVYGGPGLFKTNAIHTLVPPILDIDVGEGGTMSIMPWIRRTRNAASQWRVYTNEQRQDYYDRLTKEVRANITIKPAPLIDVVHFDPTDYDAYNLLTATIAEFDTKCYNSLALDSLQEFSESGKTFSRGPAGYMKLMSEVTKSWMKAQEWAGQRLRVLREYRDKGIFIYLTGGEDIAKDYVRNPLEKRSPGQDAPEAYSIRGTVLLPGMLSESLVHLPDILCHSRMQNGKPVWVTEPEPLPGGEAHWDAKDRSGRLNRFEAPNFRSIIKKIYGEHNYKRIYNHGFAMVRTATTDGSTATGRIGSEDMADDKDNSSNS